MNIDRIPPQALDAEAAILGSVMIEREMYAVASSFVRHEDFYAPFHATVWRAMTELFEEEFPLDKITLANRLRYRGELDVIGGLAYLTGLMDIVPTASSVEYYARIVADKSAARQIIRIANDLQGKAFEDYFESATDLQDHAIRELTKVLGRGAVDITSIEKVLETVYSRIGDVKRQPFFTQWEGIDRLTGGFQPGELIVWGASPGMGKSVGIGNYGEYTASAYRDHAFLMFSLEMTQEDTTMRILSERSGVPMRKIREGHSLTDEDWKALDMARGNLSVLPLEFVTRHPRRSMADIKRSARQTYQKHGRLSGMAIDHIGFVSDLARVSETRGTKHEALDSLLAQLLELGDELHCPVHVVYHLNRGAKDDRPTIFDLRDGGNTEGHATTIIFPWRPNPKNDPAKVDDQGAFIPPTRGEFIIAKSRFGRPGTVAMHFDGEGSMWTEADGDPAPWFERGKDWRPEAMIIP